MHGPQGIRGQSGFAHAHIAHHEQSPCTEQRSKQGQGTGQPTLPSVRGN